MPVISAFRGAIGAKDNARTCEGPGRGRVLRALSGGLRADTRVLPAALAATADAVVADAHVAVERVGVGRVAVCGHVAGLAGGVAGGGQRADAIHADGEGAGAAGGVTRVDEDAVNRATSARTGVGRSDPGHE